MNPWPGAYLSYIDKIIKILEAEYLNADHHFTPGTVISDKLEIACGSSILRVKNFSKRVKSFEYRRIFTWYKYFKKIQY